IGGGPAGAITALVLSRLKYDVVLLEASAGPVQKIGECLSPNILSLLRKLELEHLLNTGHKRSYGNRAIWGSDQILDQDFISSVYGAGTHINRQQFEDSLAQEARKSGVNWQYNFSVGSVEKEGPQWVITSKDKQISEPIFADFLVDASGRRAFVGRSQGQKRENIDNLVGVTAILDDCKVEDSFTLIEAVESGWWYSAGLPNDRLVVSFMTDSDLVNEVEANKLEAWLKMLQELTFTKQRTSNLFTKDFKLDTLKLEVKQASSSRLQEITGENWLCVGDAACTYDPLSSYGITAAMGSAYYAACAINDHLNGKNDALKAYTFLMDKMYANYLSVTQQAYLAEQRCPSSTFWKRRQMKEVSH
ncbi:MAG: NAD(P)/FAD-dependent oxidoreductase, partial [Flavobacteriales bacterium]|nr:NAD(P)/FAD-dependent oxidoreductase [Flavobacteriales bacterium]